MKTELLTLALSNYVPKRSKIQLLIRHPTTSPDTMDLGCHEGQAPLNRTEPTYIQTPCLYSTPFVSPFDYLNFHSEKKKKKKKKKKKTPTKKKKNKR